MPATPTSVTGNAATATKLATARAITLTGAVKGTANFDGSAAASIATTYTAATAATASADGAAGSAIYAKSSDTTSLNKAATPANVATQVAAAEGSKGAKNAFTVSTTVLTAATAANVTFTTPSYIVGQNLLEVNLDGTGPCRLGTATANGFYKEVGTSGAASTSIQVFDALASGQELTFKVLNQ
jgi:hypothetical protein